MKDVVKATLLGVLIIGTTATLSLARDGSHRFEALDTNGDGQITQEELAARAQDRFAEADANGDGVLDRAELLERAQSAQENRVSRMLTRLDADGDGALSAAEMENRRHGGARAFQRLDTDGNGAISEDEFAAAQDRRQKMREGPADQ